MWRITLLFLPLYKSSTRTPLPHSMLPVSSLKFMESQYNIVFFRGGGGREGGGDYINGGKREKIEVIRVEKDLIVSR